MPTYNHAAYLKDAIQTVQQQAFPNWQLIVVDDGSTDETSRILEEIASSDARITFIRQENAGPATARNAGVALAQGEWLAFLDSDDLWLSDALTIYDDFINKNPDVQFMYGYRHRIDETGEITELPGEFQSQPTNCVELFGRMYLSSMTVCYRKDLFERCGGFDESLRSCEDYELYLRMGLLCKFMPLDKPLGLRRRHSTNISRQSGWSRLQEAQLLRRFIEQQGGKGVVPEEIVSRRLSRLYYAAGRQYFKSRNFAQAVELLKESLNYRRATKTMLLKTLCSLLKPVGKTVSVPA